MLSPTSSTLKDTSGEALPSSAIPPRCLKTESSSAPASVSSSLGTAVRDGQTLIEDPGFSVGTSRASAVPRHMERGHLEQSQSGGDAGSGRRLMALEKSQ